MATLGTALIGKISGDSPAEKAFKPWWDNMQNFLVYGLVMLGKPLDFFKIPIMTTVVSYSNENFHSNESFLLASFLPPKKEGQ